MSKETSSSTTLGPDSVSEARTRLRSLNGLLKLSDGNVATTGNKRLFLVFRSNRILTTPVDSTDNSKKGGNSAQVCSLVDNQSRVISIIDQVSCCPKVIRNEIASRPNDRI